MKKLVYDYKKRTSRLLASVLSAIFLITTFLTPALAASGTVDPGSGMNEPIASISVDISNGEGTITVRLGKESDGVGGMGGMLIDSDNIEAEPPKNLDTIASCDLNEETGLYGIYVTRLSAQEIIIPVKITDPNLYNTSGKNLSLYICAPSCLGISDEIVIPIDASGNFKAPSGTITFDLNGGTYSDSTANVVISVPVGDYTSDGLSAVTGAPEPTRENYIFGGWAASSSGSAYDEANKLSVKDGDTVTVVALWTEKATPAGPAATATVYRDGMTLSDIALTDSDSNSSDAVTWAWKESSIPVNYTNNASGSAVAVSTENDTYKATEVTVNYTITQGELTVDTSSIETSYFENTKNLSDVDVSGVTAKDKNAESHVVEGSLAWDNSTSNPYTNGTTQAWTFTPSDGNYKAATGSVTFSIASASQMTVDSGFNSAEIAYGQTPLISPVVKSGENVLVLGEDYKLQYKPSSSGASAGDDYPKSAANLIKAGEYTISIVSLKPTVYTAPTDTMTLTVTQKELTAATGSVTFTDMAYNGKDKTDVTKDSGTLALDGIETGDTVTVKTVEYARTKSNVGDNVSVKGTITAIEGTDAGNYKLPSSGKIEVDAGNVKVTPKNLTISLPEITKVYDGNTTITTTITNVPLSGVISGEKVSAKWANGVSYAKKDASDTITINKSGENYVILEGDDAANYTVTQPTAPTGKITKKPISFKAGETALTVRINEDTDLAAEADYAFENLVGEEKLALGTDYSITYAVSGTDIGMNTPAGNGTDDHKIKPTTTGEGAILKATAVLKDTTAANNYKFDSDTNAKVNFTIKAVDKTVIPDTSIKFEQGNGIYNGSALGTAQAGTAQVDSGYEGFGNLAGDGEFTYTYFVDSSDALGDKTTESNSGAAGEGQAPVKAGKYWVTATWTNDNDYTGTKTVSFTIDQRNVNLLLDLDSGTDGQQTEKTYGETLTLSASHFVYGNQGTNEGFVNSDTIDDLGTFAASYASDGAAGTAAVTEDGYAVTVSEKLTSNYTFTVTNKLAVTKKELSWDSTYPGANTFTQANRPYDGSKNAKIEADTSIGVSWFTASDFANSDSSSVTLTVKKGTYADAFASENAADNIALTLPASAFELGGTAAGNYKLSSSDLVTKANITKIALTVAAKDPMPSFSTGSTPKLEDLLNVTGLVNHETLTGIIGATANVVTGPTYQKDGEVANAPLASAGDYTVSLTIDKDNFNSITGNNYTLANSVTLTNVALKVTAPAPAPGPSGNEYTVTYAAGEFGALAEGAASTEKVAKGEKPANVPGVVAKDGYKFKGWSLDGGKTLVNPAEKEITGNVTFTAVYVKVDHLPYIYGRNGTTFAPKGLLTRAEAAAILCRLSAGFDEEGSYECSFKDVAEGEWYAKYAGFAASHGIVEGYADETFRGMGKITRGEFAAMIARYMGLEPVTESGKFNDVAGYWGEGYINALAAIGAVDGYSDGGYHPNQSITREEAVKIVNIAAGRVPDKEKTFEGYENPFKDVTPDMWSYYDVLEAAVAHASQDFHSEK